MKTHFGKDEVLFTSDTHFSHANIIKYTDRPFQFPETGEMDMLMLQAFIDADNSGKTLFHMGDLMMNRSKFLLDCGWRPTGDHYIVLGNHDKNAGVDGELRKLYREFFTYIIGTPEKNQYKNNHLYINVDEHKLLLTHHIWKELGDADYNFHGHHHNDFFKRPQINYESYPWAFNSQKHINVCVELTRYKPVTFDEALQIDRPKKPA